MKLFTRGRYAAVTSTAALVVALSGTSYAATMITGRQIQDGTVTTADIKDGTLRANDLAGSTTAALSTRVYTTGNSSDTALNGSSKAVLTLQLPAGKYLVQADVTVNRSSAKGTNEWGGCHLNAPATTDQATANIPDDGTAESLAAQVVFSTSVPATVTLSCQGSAGATVRWKTLTALKVAAVTSVTAPNVARSARTGH